MPQQLRVRREPGVGVVARSRWATRQQSERCVRCPDRASPLQLDPNSAYLDRKQGSERMARLRHFAVVVRDLEKSAQFYEKVFGLKRVGRDDLEFASGIYLSDGVINLALLNYKG